MKKELTIEELLELREEEYRAHTDGIMQSIPHVINAINEVINEDEVEDIEIKWQEIQWLPRDDLFILTGTVYPQPGELITIEDSGEEIEVTKQNCHLYTRILYIGIPVVAANTYNKKQIVEFLQEKEEERANGTSDRFINAVENAVNRLEENGDSYLEERPVQDGGFDEAGLTEKQLESLYWNEMTSNGDKKH